MPVDIVTGDRDLFQLVDDDGGGAGALHRPRRRQARAGRPTRGCVEKYGVDASQYADFATLRGDASDGLPGVAGIGDKTAASPAQPVRRPGRASSPRRTIPTVDMGPGPRGKIKAAVDYLDVAPTVVAVARDIDLGSPDLTLPDVPR